MELIVYLVIGILSVLGVIAFLGAIVWAFSLICAGHLIGGLLVADERKKAIDECIKIIEETIWKDADMLVENIREFTKEGGK